MVDSSDSRNIGAPSLAWPSLRPKYSSGVSAKAYYTNPGKFLTWTCMTVSDILLRLGAWLVRTRTNGGVEVAGGTYILSYLTIIWSGPQPQLPSSFICQSIQSSLPLDCLGLGKFTDPPETRKEEGGSLRIFGSSPTKSVYPFTVFHKFDVQRRYTFCAPSELSRCQWYETFVDTLGVRKAQQDANKASPVRNYHSPTMILTS